MDSGEKPLVLPPPLIQQIIIVSNHGHEMHIQSAMSSTEHNVDSGNIDSQEYWTYLPSIQASAGIDGGEERRVLYSRPTQLFTYTNAFPPLDRAQPVALAEIRVGEKRTQLPFDLSTGFDGFVEKPFKKIEPLSPVLKSLDCPTWTYDVITWRGVFTKILCAFSNGYSGGEPFTLVAQNIDRATLLVEKKPRETVSTKQRLMAYWGRSFEHFMASLSSSVNPEGGPKGIAEFCAVMQSRLHVENAASEEDRDGIRLLFGAEMDGIDADSGLYIELKTASLDTYRQGSSKKMMRWWAQSFLAGVGKIIVGLRDRHGMLRQIDRLPVHSLSKRQSASDMLRGTMDFLKWIRRLPLRSGETYEVEFDGRMFTARHCSEEFNLL